MVVFILTAELSQTVLLVISPPSLVVGCSLIVVIDAVSILKTLAQSTLVGLSALEEIDAFTVEVVFFPIPKIGITNRIVKDALAFP